MKPCPDRAPCGALAALLRGIPDGEEVTLVLSWPHPALPQRGSRIERRATLLAAMVALKAPVLDRFSEVGGFRVRDLGMMPAAVVTADAAGWRGMLAFLDGIQGLKPLANETVYPAP